MDRRAAPAPTPGDAAEENSRVPPAPLILRSETPSTSDTASTPDGPDEVRELNKRIGTLEATIASLLTAIQIKNHVQAVTASTEPQDSRDEEASPSPTLCREPPSTHSSVISKSAVRDALALVPTYDGHNMSVMQFARACKRARELIRPSDEGDLARYLRGKLTGHAYMTIEDESLVTVDQILDALKQTFSPARTPNWYRGQLSVARKNPHEHILDYVGRVKELRSAIIESDQSKAGRDLTKREIVGIDAEVIDAFFEGLPAQYRAEIRIEECGSPTEAFHKAIAVARRLEKDQIHEGNSRTGQPVREQIRDPRLLPPAPRQIGGVAREPPPVTILRRDPTAPPAFNSRAPRANDNPFPNTRKICGYCQNFGHLMSECRKRQFNSGATPRAIQGNAPAASANESRGRSNRQLTLPLEGELLPSTSSNPSPEESLPSS